MKWKKSILGFFYVIIFIITFNLIYNLESIKDHSVFSSNKTLHYSSFDVHDLFNIQSIIEYGEHSVIGVHYPVLGKQNIDYMIEDLILTSISEFKVSVADETAYDPNYKSELHIDFEALKGPKDIISIKFTILENTLYFANPRIEVKTLVVDLNRDKKVLLRNVFKGKYLERISFLAQSYFSELEGYKDYINTTEFKHGIKADFKNYSSFLLEQDRIVVIFQKYQLFPGFYGLQAIEIPFTFLEDYLRKDFLENGLIETYSPLEIIESEKTESIIDEMKESEEYPTQEEIQTNSRTIDPNKPMVALTFDDGPYFRVTVPILNTLKKYDSVATFFVLGNRVPNHKNILKRMINEGNEIGNHSFNHKQLTTLTTKELQDQIYRTQRAVEEVIGSEPKVLRPTYGSYDKSLRSEIEMPIILWSIDPQDWKVQDAKKINDHVLSRVRDGDIILLHDLFEATADAVELLVPELLDRGFQLVTVSELYESRGEALQVGNIYSHSRKR